MKAMKVYITQRFTDWIHERHIAWHGWRLMHARTRPRQLFHWRRMAAGIHARSPAQVARMEAARGLGPLDAVVPPLLDKLTLKEDSDTNPKGAFRTPRHATPAQALSSLRCILPTNEVG